MSSGSSGRFSVQTVNSDRGVLSSLVLSETLAQDFQLRYNCTAWNRFGTGTMLVMLKEQGEGHKNITGLSQRQNKDSRLIRVSLFRRNTEHHVGPGGWCVEGVWLGTVQGHGTFFLLLYFHLHIQTPLLKILNANTEIALNLF